MAFKFFKQHDAMDCGPACLRMIAKYYGRHYKSTTLRQLTRHSKRGVDLLGISQAAKQIGFNTRGLQLTYDQLINEVPLPCIAHWDQNHFIVIIQANRWFKKKISIADPAKGKIILDKEQFLSSWASTENKRGEKVGHVLLLQTTPSFYANAGEKRDRFDWKLITQYLFQRPKIVGLIILALLINSLLQMIFPYLAQSIVDTGISLKNLHFITIVLLAQFMLMFSRIIIEFIRIQLLLQLSIFVNLSLLSDFWIKLTRLPFSYFDRQHTGDTIQRINDNKQIQNFFTTTTISIIFSLFNFIFFAVILANYNIIIFLIFLTGNLLYFFWILIFLTIRKKINTQSFHISASENNATLQLIQGMSEIKLNNVEQQKRWEWEDLQSEISILRQKTLTYNQYQQIGSLLITQGKDIVITFLVATLVIQEQLTLGSMLAIQYILAQLGSPIEQFMNFIQSAQDTHLSLERLGEVHELDDEEEPAKDYITTLPNDKSIYFNNVSFSYPGLSNNLVLNNIHLCLPEGKVSAIVGVSGSGKTTLLKLLLRFYEPVQGNIKTGDRNFTDFSPSFWRQKCGAVLQDGYIFDDSIGKNIAFDMNNVDMNHLIQCCKTANIYSFIETLPNGFATKLGADGITLSQGQKQRVLIARAIYKNPLYLFFDEATNALDANNEKMIVENLRDVYTGKTVVVLAHRLSTVKDADKIIVMEGGKIVEEGSHHELTSKRGKYFELVKNQLELGNQII